MALAVETRASLLLRLRDPADQNAWGLFVETYGPLVYRYARRRGLQDADSADLTQHVLWEVSEAVGRFSYDPRRGTFRGWLFGLVHRQWCKRQRRERRRLDRHTTGVGLGDCAATSAEEEEWDREYEHQLFLQAAQQARGLFTDTSWMAFWRTAVQGEESIEVARSLGLTLGAVYTAKSRVLDRLREIVQELRATWDEP